MRAALLALLAAASPAAAQEARLGEARAALNDGVLRLETGRVARSFSWNGGDLIGLTLENPSAGRIWTLAGDAPDVALPIDGTAMGDGRLTFREVLADAVVPAHLLAIVETRIGGLDVRRSCALFPGSPAIGCTVALRGEAPADWTAPAEHGVGMIETTAAPVAERAFRTDRLALPGRHWRAEAVRFLTATDHNDTLVYHDDSLLYRSDKAVDGNILRLEAEPESGQIFVLKQAPPGRDQLGWPGQDYLARIGDVRVSGSGFRPADLSADRWTEAYGVTVGVAAPGRRAFLEALRAHQETARTYRTERDSMLLSNTWGDRSRDSRMNEAFLLAEIDAAAALGLTHVQLDDGWQAGLSKNSATRGGSRWTEWTAEDWRPHPERFPRGLAPLVAHANARGIRLGLWFNPTQTGDYSQWRRDADILIGYWRDHGIGTFKIDGVNVHSKEAERNLRAFYERIEATTGGQALFNVDVTAGRRPGYFFMNRFGNIFLENRYTDWGNYYPHRTLRNLWMLAAYVPPQLLQIEFLNLIRNADQYQPGDPLAPGAIPFDYAFAATMAAQPLAWMEVSGLPPEGRALATLVPRYRAIQPDLHRGRIFPVGAEPDGASWTGFQSILPDGASGYLIVYREPLAAEADGSIVTFLDPGRRTRFEPLLGDGRPFEATPGPDGRIAVSLPESASFALYRYVQD